MRCSPGIITEVSFSSLSLDHYLSPRGMEGAFIMGITEWVRLTYLSRPVLEHLIHRCDCTVLQI